jgi:uncharacterized protein (TIGR00730 family)
MPAICVFCASSQLIPHSYISLAEQVGGRLAAGGHSLVYGGGRVSMMGGVARAARRGGARTFGVIPHRLVDVEDADDADAVVVNSMRERKRLMDDRADAFLALPGGLGTLEELLGSGRLRPSACTANPSSFWTSPASSNRCGSTWLI